MPEVQSNPQQQEGAAPDDAERSCGFVGVHRPRRPHGGRALARGAASSGIRRRPGLGTLRVI